MTKPKEVAKTLKSVLNQDLVESILDRTSNINPVIDEVSKFWKFDLFTRKPGPAYIDGTDLDMASFLFSLVERGAVINLPTYEGLRQSKIKEGQRVISSSNRHGKIMGVYANKDVFTFGVRILDMNVMGQENGVDKVGFPRNFSLTDLEGKWFSGWKTIQFMPSVSENKFLTENKQWDPLKNNRITFRYLVHPNRWTSFYGQYYFITKMLINRLTEEASNYNLQIKKMLNDGIKYPPSDEKSYSGKSYVTEDKGKKVKTLSFKTEVITPENESEYPIYDSTQENLINLTRKRKDLSFSINPYLRFMTRATEFAFYTNGIKDGKERFPGWLKNVKWERDYKPTPRSRNTWDRLVLFQPEVGKKGVSICKRISYKTETISE